MKFKRIIKQMMTIILALTVVAMPLYGFHAFAVATGNTYYVSATGSDTNTGLEAAKPFKTFKKALEVAVAGDVILARGGVYSEKITISKSGSPGAPITIKNMDGETPVLDGTGMSAGYDGMINITNKNHITIEGFEIRNLKSTSSSTVPMGISVYGTGSNIQLLNNKIHHIENPNGNAHGIRVYGTSGTTAITNLVITGNEIYSNKLGQSEALVVNGNVDGFKVNYNIVHDNDNIGIDFIGYERTAPANDYARNGECVGNLVYNISSANNPTYGGDACAGGIYVDGGVNILIDRNIVKNCDIGIEVATERGPVTKNITVTNNLITDCKPQAGISFGAYEGSSGGGVENLKVFGNTLYNNTYAIQIQKASSSTNLIKGNIFYGGKAITGTIGSNVFANNLTSDPMFVNAAAGDFTLKAGSPAIDTGTDAFGALDLAGKPRVAGLKVDLGAYEYQTTVSAPKVNSAPVTMADAASTEEGVAVSVNVLANDTDADGDTLSVSGVSQPANGTVIVAGDLLYTPKTGFSGIDAFTYTVSDGMGGTAQGTVTITVTPKALTEEPVTAPEPEVTVPEESGTGGASEPSVKGTITLTASPDPAQFSDVVILTATHIPGAIPVSDNKVYFEINGNAVGSSTLSSSNVATMSVKIQNEPGICQVRAYTMIQLDGILVEEAAASSPLSVNKETLKVSYTGSTSLSAGSKVTLSGLARDMDGSAFSLVGVPAKIVIRDSKNNVVFETTKWIGSKDKIAFGNYTFKTADTYTAVISVENAYYHAASEATSIVVSTSVKKGR